MIHHRKKFTITALFLAGLTLAFYLESCKPDDDPPKVYNPTAFEVQIPAYFPPFPVNPDNELTVQGVALGKRLFYDKILSGDNTQSCATCHQQEANFVDKEVRFSEGIDVSVQYPDY